VTFSEPVRPPPTDPIPRPALQEDEGQPFPTVPPAKAEPVTTVEWNPRWRTAGLWDAVVIGAGSVIIIGDNVLDAGSDEADWSRPILWDADLRDALRIRVSGGRDTAATISDTMMIGSLVHNLLFDNLVVAWAIHGEPKLASQMSVMNAEAYAIALSLTSIVKNVTSRARPLVEECEADPDYSVDCNSLNRYRSFFSGHASTTAVGAGLLCAHHLNVPLYDNGILDAGTCAMGIALTVATGAMRIASDNHWATDVHVGHLVGFASGFLVPTLLYYTEDDDEPEPEASGTHALLLPAAGRNYMGLQLVGGFD
jgi:hypothetical protein